MACTSAPGPLLIAVARENNSLEVWLKSTWSQLLLIPGNKNCPIRNIHWLEQPGTVVDKNPLYAGGKKRRLFTTGLNG